MMYGSLCTEFYDVDKKFANDDELELYIKEFSKADRILEPMCGSGRLLIPLVKNGYNVEGIDNSNDMLDSCKKRSQDVGVSPVLHHTTFEDFKDDKKYNGIIIPLGSFQLFYPRSKAYEALEKINKLLMPEGKLIFDLFIPWESMYENAEAEKSEKTVVTGDNSKIVIKNITTTNKYEQHMISTSTYTKFIDKKETSSEEEVMDILWYFHNETLLILDKFGFNNVRFVKRFLNGGDHITYIAQK